MKTQASRRKFMANIVGAAAAARLMPLMPHHAFGATEAPKRLLLVFHGLGYLENSFWPKGEGSDFTLGETQKPLEPYKDKLLYPSGLFHSAHSQYDKRSELRKVNTPDNVHGTGIAGMFTGSMKDIDGKYAMTESIDQTVAKHLHAQKPTAYKSIALAGYWGAPGPHSSAFFTGPSQPVTPTTIPRVAFETYFAKLEINNTGAGNAAAAAAAARRKLLNQTVVDTVRGEFNAICSRLGSSERKLCDAHLAGLHSVEKRLQNASAEKPAECSKPVQSGATDTEAEIRANIDLIRSIFACDLTRVATLQVGHGDGGVDLDPRYGLHDQHGTTHNMTDAPSEAVVKEHKGWDNFFAKQWLYLLEQLSSIPEGSGSMLDNTLIVFGSDSTTNQSRRVGAHSGYRFPMWIAGGGNFAFKTGRQLMLPIMPDDIDVTAENQWGYNHNGGKYLYHNALLVSVAQAFGMNINAYGNLDQGVGGVPGLK